MDIIKKLTEHIELAGKFEQQNMRILQGLCVYCGRKLPENNPSYHCQPDCRSHLTARCEEGGLDALR